MAAAVGESGAGTPTAEPAALALIGWGVRQEWCGEQVQRQRWLGGRKLDGRRQGRLEGDMNLDGTAGGCNGSGSGVVGNWTVGATAAAAAEGTARSDWRADTDRGRMGDGCSGSGGRVVGTGMLVPPPPPPPPGATGKEISRGTVDGVMEVAAAALYGSAQNLMKIAICVGKYGKGNRCSGGVKRALAQCDGPAQARGAAARETSGASAITRH